MAALAELNSTTSLTSRAQSILDRLMMADERTAASERIERAQLREDLTDRANLKGDLSRFDDAVRAGAYDTERVPVERKKITDRIDALSRRIDVRQEKLTRKAARKTAAMVQAELVKLGPVDLVDDETTKAVPDKGKTARETLAVIDDSIASAKAERKELLAAPITAADLREKLTADVRAKALRGKPDLTEAWAGGNVRWPQSRLPLAGSFDFRYVPNGLDTLCWLFGDQIIEKLEEEIQFEDNEHALSPAEKAEAVADLDATITALHYRRAAIVEAIVSDGGDANHSPETPALAVLRLRRA